MGPSNASTVEINCPWKAILSPSASRSRPVPLSYDDNLLSAGLFQNWAGWKVLGVPWLIPSNFPGLFQTTFAESITGGEWFIGTAGISVVCRHHHRHHHLPVHPSLPLIPSINASRQAPGYRSPSSSTLLSCTPASLHPSIPLHHSQLKGAAWVALICSYEYASASYPLAKRQVKWLPGLHTAWKWLCVWGLDDDVVWTGNTLVHLIP